MKNKKIYKIFTFVVLLTVLLSVACVSSSAYVYQGNSASYFIPEKLYFEEPYYTEFQLNVIDNLPCGVDNGISYITAGTNVSSNCFTGEDMILRNANDPYLVPYYDNWLLYTFVDDFVDEPVLYTFSITASCTVDALKFINFNFAYQNPEDFGTSNYNDDDTETIIVFEDFLTSIPNFLYYVSDTLVEVNFDVEVIVDRKSNTAFITLIDRYNGGTYCTSKYVYDNTFIGFELRSFVESGWNYVGFGYNLTHCSYDGFTSEVLLPVESNSRLKKKTVISLDGSSYEGMTPNETNYSNGFSTDYNSYPVIENGYYKLTTNSSSSSQAQLWFPSQEYGISDFSSDTHSFGSLSFDISAAVREYLEFKFVEGSSGERWGSEWCIADSFLKIVPSDFSFDTYVAVFDILDINGNVLFQYNVDAFDPYSEWINISLGIELDPVTDSLILIYHINGKYCGICSKPLTTANNSITSVYCSLRTYIEGSGVLLDNFRFSYANDNTYREEYSSYLNGYLDKISSKESLLYYDYVGLSNSLQNTIDSLEKDKESLNDRINYELIVQDELKKELAAVNEKMLIYKSNADLDKLFPSISQSILVFVKGIASLGITIGGISITIGGLLTIAVIGLFISFILKIWLGRG